MRSTRQDTDKGKSLEEDKNSHQGSQKAHKKTSIEDFEVIKLLGEGAYAKVYQVKHKATNRIYAMKVIVKEYMHKVMKY